MNRIFGLLSFLLIATAIVSTSAKAEYHGYGGSNYSYDSYYRYYPTSGTSYYDPRALYSTGGYGAYQWYGNVLSAMNYGSSYGSTYGSNNIWGGSCGTYYGGCKSPWIVSPYSGSNCRSSSYVGCQSPCYMNPCYDTCNQTPQIYVGVMMPINYYSSTNYQPNYTNPYTSNYQYNSPLIGGILPRQPYFPYNNGCGNGYGSCVTGPVYRTNVNQQIVNGGTNRIILPRGFESSTHR